MPAKKKHKKKQHKIAAAKTDAKKADVKPATEPMAKPTAPTDSKK
jgi:hypothetical protein